MTEGVNSISLPPASPQGAYASDCLTATAALFYACVSFSHKSFAPQNLCGSPIRVVPRARMCGRAAEGFALIFQVRFRSRQFSSSVKTPKLLFFRSLKTASSFPEEGDDVQCVKRGEGPPKKLPRRARQEVGITSSLVAVKRGDPQKKHPRPVKRKGRHNPRLRKQQKNSSSARPHGGGIYLPNSVVTGAGRFGTSRLELNVESNFRCDQVGRSLQVLFIRSALRPFGEIVRWSVLLIRDLPRLTGNEVCHIKRTSRYEIFSE